ncbi:hypothetical protein P8452_57884 [Trifolium repens]|nr:hypothetical protein P8452_57884 [Trifolium repens]
MVKIIKSPSPSGCLSPSASPFSQFEVLTVIPSLIRVFGFSGSKVNRSSSLPSALFKVGVEMETIEEMEKLEEAMINSKRRQKEMKQQVEVLRKSLMDDTEKMMAEIQSVLDKMAEVTIGNEEVTKAVTTTEKRNKSKKNSRKKKKK